MRRDQTEILNSIPRTAELSWETAEFHHEPVNTDWYWTAGMVSLVIAGIAIYMSDPLFAAFAILAGFTIIMLKIRGPEPILVRLTPRGIIVKKTLYPYARIESFWIFEREKGIHRINELSIKSDRAILPQIIIPLGDTDVELVRDYLSSYLEEEYHEKTTADLLSDYLGI